VDETSVKTPHTPPRAMFENMLEARRRRRVDDPHAWIAALHGPPAIRAEALAELRELLLRGARFELSRSRQLPLAELEDLAVEATDDALVVILARLGSFRAASRFTTWASKFVLHIARRKLRAALAGAADGAGTILP
jgi:hypothetical protein